MAIFMRQGSYSRRRIRGALFVPLVFLAVCVVMIFSISIFFRVAKIEVVGNSRYTREEIIIASGIEEGENLVFLNRFTAVSRLFSRMPYIETTSVTRQLPNKVVIEISECVSIAYVTLDGQPWIIDRNCKVLAQAKPEDMQTLIRIDGVAPINPTVGEKMELAPEEAAKITYLSEILDQIQERGMQLAVRTVDITNIASPNMTYMGRFYVVFGSLDNTEFKFGKLVSAVSQLTQGDNGTIDLSDAGAQVVFSPG